MNLSAVSICCCLSLHFCSAQTRSETEIQIANNYPLQNKVVFLQTIYNDADIAAASGILVNKNDKIYLVTNYHIIPKRSFLDTNAAQNMSSPLLPNLVTITFHGKDQNFYKKTFDIGPAGSYITVPAIDNIYSDPFPYQITDLVFIPLGKMDDNIFLDTLPLSHLQKMPAIQPRGLFSIWGFRGGQQVLNQYPNVDTVLSLPETSFSQKDKYLYFQCYKDLRGCSGAPVYYHTGKKYYFLGIQSAVVPNKLIRTKTKTGSVGLIISSSAIKMALDKYVN